MQKEKIKKMGSIFVVILLVLTAFPSIARSETIVNQKKSVDENAIDRFLMQSTNLKLADIEKMIMNRIEKADLSVEEKQEMEKNFKELFQKLRDNQSQNEIYINIGASVTSGGVGFFDQFGIINIPPTGWWIFPILGFPIHLIIYLIHFLIPFRVTLPWTIVAYWWYNNSVGRGCLTQSTGGLADWVVRGTQYGFVIGLVPYFTMALRVGWLAPPIFHEMGMFYAPQVLLVAVYSKNNSVKPAQIEDTEKSEEYTPHDPIYIEGNNGFTPENGVVGGSGTADDPYIIEGWEINASTAIGIDIRNTDAYFIIRNCYIHDGWSGKYEGIGFSRVKNGKIENCLLYHNYDGGIYLNYSSNCYIENCICDNNLNGIGLWVCNNITISNCTVKNNFDDGIELLSSHNNYISNCLLENNLDGFLLWFATKNIITDCKIINASAFGVLSWIAGSNYIKNSDIQKNLVGFYCSLSTLKINYNNIYHNYQFGLFATDCIIDATNNWWGSEDGPGGRGPGKGDSIIWATSIVSYRPWLQKPVR